MANPQSPFWATGLLLLISCFKDHRNIRKENTWNKMKNLLPKGNDIPSYLTMLETIKIIYIIKPQITMKIWHINNSFQFRNIQASWPLSTEKCVCVCANKKKKRCKRISFKAGLHEIIKASNKVSENNLEKILLPQFDGRTYTSLHPNLNHIVIKYLKYFNIDNSETAKKKPLLVLR